MTISVASAKTADLAAIRKTLNRALVLHDRAVVSGGTSSGTGAYTPFLNADKRDLAVFIFFEAAAAFEYFAQKSFILAIRKRYAVQPKFAANLGGTIDHGMRGVMGWAAPGQIVDRARKAFGKQHFLAKLKANLPPNHYDWLSHAHRVRNRIAHPGDQTRTQVNKILQNLGVPARSRQGLSMGRLLADYPGGTPANDRWFHRFIAAYSSYVDLVNQKL